MIARRARHTCSALMSPPRGAGACYMRHMLRCRVHDDRLPLPRRVCRDDARHVSRVLCIVLMRAAALPPAVSCRLIWLMSLPPLRDAHE